MQTDRLLRLADLLEADANNPQGIKFDLGWWGEADEGVTVGVNCGTSACALGLAALSGIFKNEGLGYVIEPWRGGTSQNLLIVFDGEHGGFSAAEQLFDIEWNEAEWLFDVEDYNGVLHGREGELKVAKRIRDFVAGTDHPPERD